MRQTFKCLAIAVGALLVLLVGASAVMSQHGSTGGSQTEAAAAEPRVLPTPILSSSYKSWQGQSLGYGGLLTYTVSLVNTGSVGANAILTDTIPAGTVYHAGPNVGSYDPGTDSVLWSGLVSAGTTLNVSFVVSITVTDTAVITNSAWIDDDVHLSPFEITCSTHVAAVAVETGAEPFYCGDLVVVPVRVYNASDLQGFQMDLSFDPNVLALRSAQPGATFQPLVWEGKEWDNTTGKIRLYYALRNRPTGLDGDLDLVILSFRAVGDGVSPITLDACKLSDSPYPYFAPIPHNRFDGSITVQPRALQGRVILQGRDYEHGESMANTSLMEGNTVLTQTDAGGYYSLCPPVASGETFTLKAFKAGYLYGVRSVTVPASGTLTLGNVTLAGGDVVGVRPEIVASPGPPTCSAVITVTRAGPPDGRVYINDLAFVGANFGKHSGSPDWGPDPCHPNYVAYKADINEDGHVDILDLVLVGYNFNRAAPVTWP